MSAIDLFGRTPAATIRVAGRYALASRYDLAGNRREFACRTWRMSPFQALIAAPVLAPVGERAILYFTEFGKLDGWISDLTEDALLIDINADKEARTKLANKLAWLERQQKNTSRPDVRRQKRLVPENPHSTLILKDGRMMGCFVIDMSPSGVAVSADIELPIGTHVAIGSSVGHVVRHFNEGFAVKFDRMQDVCVLERMVRQPASFSTNPFAGSDTRAPVPKGGQPVDNARDVPPPVVEKQRPAAERKPPADDPSVWYI